MRKVELNNFVLLRLLVLLTAEFSILNSKFFRAINNRPPADKVPGVEGFCRQRPGFST